MAGRTFGAAVAMAIALASTGLAHAADPEVIASHSFYFPEEDIDIHFSAGPGNPKDWIGIYPTEVEPGSVGSTIWRYVDDTDAGTVGLQEGTVHFPGGLALGGEWAAYLLLNDGYTKLATNLFTVVDPGTTLVRTDRRSYTTGASISVTFTNGPANPADWIGIYKEGETPGGPTSTLWAYVGGTQTAGAGLTDGTITFGTGLSAAGRYVVHFLLNDGYDILASETFTVTEPAPSTPRLLFASPADGSTDEPPILTFSASITNGTSQINTSAVVLQLDDVPVTATVTESNGLVVVSHTSTILPAPGSVHRWVLVAPDNATPPNELRVERSIVVADYVNVVLPAPLYFENFDAVPEGSLPSGWTQKSYTTPLNDAVDFGDLGSAAFAQWTAVDAARFEGTFVTYSNPDNPDGWESDYQRVLRTNPLNVLNGAVYDQPLASGRFLIGNSGYQNSGASQVLYLFTPDYDLSGKTNIHLSFKSLWEQNQDSLAAIEFSVDRGTTWKPVAYFLEPPDIVTISNDFTGEVTIDAETTLYTEYGDVARYVDDDGNDVGGYYGAFIAAPIAPDLAPFIQARINDDPVESKRIELFALPDADNQAAVRFRFAHAGTDSWYFGIDDFGLYSIGAGSGEPPALAVGRDANGLRITWTGTLEAADSIRGPWSSVPGVASPATIPATDSQKFYRAVQ